MFNEIIAAFALILGGGLFIYSKDAQGSFPNIEDLNINKIFDTPQPLSQSQDNPNIAHIEVMARTIWGEARGQGFAGMQAVASVIMNRLYAAQKSSAKARQYGRTIEEIVKKPYQFSVWNRDDPNLSRMLSVGENNAEFRRAVAIASRAVRGNLPDNTGGADHYLNVNTTKQIRGGTLPVWADLSKTTAKIGVHTFLKLS